MKRRSGLIIHHMITGLLLLILVFGSVAPVSAAEDKETVMDTQITMIQDAIMELVKFIMSNRDMSPDLRKQMMGTISMIQGQLLIVTGSSDGTNSGFDPDRAVTEDEIFVEADVSEGTVDITITKPDGSSETFSHEYTPSDPDLDVMSKALELQDDVYAELVDNYGYTYEDLYEKGTVTVNRFDSATEVRNHLALARDNDEIPDDYIDYFGVHSIINDIDFVAGAVNGAYLRVLTDQDEELRVSVQPDPFYSSDGNQMILYRAELYIHGVEVLRDHKDFSTLAPLTGTIYDELKDKGKYFGVSDEVAARLLNDFIFYNDAFGKYIGEGYGFYYDFSGMDVHRCLDKKFYRDVAARMAEVTILDQLQLAAPANELLTLYARPLSYNNDEQLVVCNSGDYGRPFFQGITLQ